jgi:hypothetical protein
MAKLNGGGQGSFQDFFYSLNARHHREPYLLAIRCMSWLGNRLGLQELPVNAHHSVT